MKYFVILITVLLSASLATVVYAAKKDPTKSCTYRFLSCMDNCEYHQHVEQIAPCKSQCKRKYSCRPKIKRHLPVKHEPFSAPHVE